MDWLRILLTVVGLYIVFLVFTKFTKWLFKGLIIILLIAALIYGNLHYESIFGEDEFTGADLEEISATDKAIEINESLFEEDADIINETLSNETG